MGSPRAQSESIGVILMAAVVITVTTVGGVVVLGNVADDADSASDPLVDFDVELTANEVAVTHAGGDVVAESDLTVIARGDTTTERYGFDAANVTGDGDGQFEPSERFRRDHDLTGTTVEVAVVHDASNTVLARESLTVGEPGEQLPPVARFGASPDDPDPGETVTFDASASDDNDGTISAYRWEFGDGTTATTAGPTVDHTYSSEANYTVNLTVEDDDGATDTASKTYWVTPLRAPERLDGTASGLDYEYYEGTYTSLPDFDAERPVKTGAVSNFDISVRERGENFAFRYTGYVEVPENGEYTFYTDSDDGSRLYIGDERVVDNPGRHAARERSGTIELRSGYHPITVTFFEHTGGEVLDVRWDGPDIASKQAIPDANLSREPSPTARFEDTCVGLSCRLNASASTAPGSSIDNYRWNVSGDVQTTSDPTLNYEFGSPGAYDVNLTVRTADGKTAQRNGTVTVETLRPADDPGGLTQGIGYEYYEADGEFTSIPDYDALSPTRTGTTDQIDLDPSYRQSDFAFVYTGYLDVPRNDSYTLYTESDDGSELYVGSQLIVDNGGLHGANTESGTIGLEEGRHEITVVMFEHTGGEVLDVRWSSPNISEETIPAENLSRDVETARVETVADWDGATAADGVVHDGTGDRQADRLRLGYPAVDTGGSNLSGYWPLDEDSGTTAVDASASGYDGDVNGAAIGSGGVLGTTAYGFDDSAWVQLDGYPNLDDEIAISAWIYTTDNSEEGQRIFVDDENNGGGYALSLGDPGTGQLRFYSRGVSPVSLDTGAVIENDRWYHVAAVANTTTSERRIYVNGTLEASDGDGGYSGTWGTDSGPAAIGGEVPGGETSNRFNGRIDEVRVYNRTLSTTEVEALNRTGYNGTLTTGTRTLTYEVSPSELTLENVSANRPPGTTISVTVLSDPDGDGTFDERSDTVTLDGSSSYDVTGLASDSRRFRFEVELATSSPTATPTVDRLDLSE